MGIGGQILLWTQGWYACSTGSRRTALPEDQLCVHRPSGHRVGGGHSVLAVRWVNRAARSARPADSLCLCEGLEQSDFFRGRAAGLVGLSP